MRVGALPAVAAGVAVWGALATGFGTALAPLPFAYLVLCLGSASIGSRIGRRYDVSYGVYIYGWPVQQLLAAARIPSHVSALEYAALALVLVWPLGFLSCVAVEQPAQRLRKALRPTAVEHRLLPEAASQSSPSDDRASTTSAEGPGSVGVAGIGDGEKLAVRPSDAHECNFRF